MNTTTNHTLFSDKLLRDKTGRSWSGWLPVLDSWDAEHKGLIATRDYLKREHGLDYYWAQVLAVYYLWKHLGVVE